MEDCEGQSIANAYNTLYNSLETKDLKPSLQKIENKASNILIKILLEKNIDFQLVSTYMHWRNADERAIQTFKNCFIVGLCSDNPELPLKLWDRLLD